MDRQDRQMRETVMDKQQRRQMLDRLIDLKNRYGSLDAEDRTPVLSIEDVAAFVEELWATAEAAADA
jgi:type IV secretory pathway VirJ component